jgi:hypothetical protein
VTWMQSLVVYVSLGVVVAGHEERHNLRRLWEDLSKRWGTVGKDVESPAVSALAGVDRVPEPTAIRILHAHPPQK